MDSAAEGRLFRRYWRTFLPLWLVPLPAVAAVLLADFASPDFSGRVLPYIVLGILVYFIIAEIRVIGPWRRSEITYLQSWILAMPFGAVAVACVLLRAVLLQLFRT